MTSALMTSTVLVVSGAVGLASIPASASPIINDPPVARATAAPNPAHAGETVVLDGSGSTDEETPSGQLLYSWDFGDDTTPTDQSSAQFEVQHAYATAGVYTATLTVRDPQGRSDTDQVVVEVDDTAPVAHATATPKTAKVSQNIAFDGSGTIDAETPDAGLTFEWDFADGTTGTGVAPNHAYAEAGSYWVRLTVADPQGVTDTDAVTIIVTNTAPVPDGTITPASPHVGETVTFDGTATTDAETSAELVYDWDFGDRSPHATSAVATHVYTSTGSRTVRLKVTDPQGLTNTKTFTLSVTANGAPIAVANASQAMANVGQSVTFDGADSSDPEGTVLTYAWDFDDGTADADTATATHQFTAPGTYDITLTVTDGFGLTSTDQVSLAVGNTAPTADLVVAPDPAHALQILSFDGSGSTDAETPDQLTYSWLFGDGSSTPYGTDPAATHAYATAGTVTVTLRVKDAKGALDIATFDLEVLPNAAPVASATATPDPAHIGSAITFSGATSTDADGDALTYEWEFPGGTTASGPTVQHSFTSVGTQVVTLTVTDPYGAADSTVLDVNVINDAPTAAFTRSGGLHVVGTAISFDAARSDDTETPADLTYTWDFGDGTSASGPDPTHTYQTPGAYHVSLTVSDPHGGTSTATKVDYIAARLACQSASVTRSAHWRVVRSADARGGSLCDNLHDGAPSGGRMTFTVSGPRLGITFARSTAGGTAQVWIDGVLKGTVNFHSAASRPRFGYRKVLSGLSSGQHTVKLKVISGAAYVDDLLVYGPVG